ncbi:uncharacterized protein B0H64DRAFT_454985 [Chaetomium fimeti]|uniref:Uncharacterized protein n=1 Tax=Chaetomium fimeti TaxID=1854472 RepID=A0AAE0HMB6_9PEZI|nr:hypothetical protein B0H64DRAFT_454985 [Chaetomium fimeti]
MRFLPLLVPLASAETLGSWTISALSRQCTPSNTACTYTLSLTTPDPPRQQHQQQQQQHTCTFTITSPDPDPANHPASHTDFTAIPCHNSNPNTNPNTNNDNDINIQNKYTYTLTGSWNPQGSFLTLVPTDPAAGRHAFFGYGEAELAGGRVAGLRRAAVYRVGAFDGAGEDVVKEGVGSNGGGGGGGGVRRGVVEKRGRMRVGMEMMEEEGSEMMGGGVERVGKRGDAEEGSKWQIKGLTRFPDMAANTTTWQFTIVHSGGEETHCSPTAPTSDPVGSFYGIPCGINDDADFKASWGVPNGTDAWFGYEQVSHNQWLGDSKKEPVYYTGCG